MDHFEFFCQYCGQRLEAYVTDVGQPADCPSCSMRITIPPPPSSFSQPTMQAFSPTADPGIFEFVCPACYQALSANTDDAGLDVACPACDCIFAIPDPTGPAEMPDATPIQDPIAHRHRPLDPTPYTHYPPAAEEATAVAFDHFAESNDGFAYPASLGPEDETADAVPLDPRSSRGSAGGRGPSNVFSFNESQRTLDDLMHELPDLRQRSLPNLQTTRLTQGSIPVTPTISERFGSETQQIEELTDAQADAVKLRAVRLALDAMNSTNECFAIIEPAMEMIVPNAPRPRFWAFVRPDLANPRSSWVFVFFPSHIIAYHIGDRKTVICRAPNFQLDVLFKPPATREGKAHLGFRLATGDTVHCLLQLTMAGRGPLTISARDFSIRIRSWVKSHPVLGPKLEERVRQRTDERERQRQLAEEAAMAELAELEQYADELNGGDYGSDPGAGSDPGDDGDGSDPGSDSSNRLVGSRTGQFRSRSSKLAQQRRGRQQKTGSHQSPRQRPGPSTGKPLSKPPQQGQSQRPSNPNAPPADPKTGSSPSTPSGPGSQRISRITRNTKGRRPQPPSRGGRSRDDRDDRDRRR